MVKVVSISKWALVGIREPGERRETPAFTSSPLLHLPETTKGYLQSHCKAPPHLTNCYLHQKRVINISLRQICQMKEPPTQRISSCDIHVFSVAISDIHLWPLVISI